MSRHDFNNSYFSEPHLTIFLDFFPQVLELDLGGDSCINRVFQ